MIGTAHDSDHGPRARVAQADYGIPYFAMKSVDEACTKWLRKRGLMMSREEMNRATHREKLAFNLRATRMHQP